MPNTNDRLPDLVKSEAKKFNSEGNLNYLIPVKDCKTDEEFMEGVKQTARYRIIEEKRWSHMLERETIDFKVEKLTGAEWEQIAVKNDLESAKECIEIESVYKPVTRVIMEVEIEDHGG